MTNTKLTKSQAIQQVYKDVKTEEYGKVDIIVNIRHDDGCGNGHNSFSLTGSIYEAGKARTDRNMLGGGAIGDTIEKYIPKISHLNKWHLCSTDRPMHYIANTLYHAKEIPKKQDSYFLYMSDKEYDFNELLGIYNAKECEGIEKKYSHATFERKMRENSMAKESNLEYARSSAIWKDATLEQLQNEHLLLERLPQLMKEFQRDIEKLGFTY